MLHRRDDSHPGWESVPNQTACKIPEKIKDGLRDFCFGLRGMGVAPDGGEHENPFAPQIRPCGHFLCRA